MAKLKFETTANLKPIDDLLTRIKELEQHIASLKKEMRSINAADPKIDPLLKDLKASKEEINNLVAEINRIKQAQLDRQREQEQAATREKESIASLLRAYEELRQKVADTANKSTSPSSGANNAPSIKEETQAYDELLSKIRTLLGSREETIASMLREENAIRLIKKRAKRLAKARIRRHKSYGSPKTAENPTDKLSRRTQAIGFTAQANTRERNKNPSRPFVAR